MEFLERLNTFRWEEESDAAFSRRAGVSPATMCYWLQGRPPSYGSVLTVSLALGTTALWLLEGEGPRDRNEYRAWLKEKEDLYEKG